MKKVRPRLRSEPRAHRLWRTISVRSIRLSDRRRLGEAWVDRVQQRLIGAAEDLYHRTPIVRDTGIDVARAVVAEIVHGQGGRRGGCRREAGDLRFGPGVEERDRRAAALDAGDDQIGRRGGAQVAGREVAAG